MAAEVIRTLRSQDIRDSLAREGFEPIGDTPEQLVALIKSEVPRLTPAQEEALDLFGDLSAELALNMDFEPGDIQLLNNHLTYHARTRYDDFEGKDKKRLLLRLWLAVPGSRPLPPGYELLFGNIEAGAVRGGVASKEGWRDVNEFRPRRHAATAH